MPNLATEPLRSARCVLTWTFTTISAVLLGAALSNPNLAGHMLLRGGLVKRSTWLLLYHGNWPQLLVAAFLGAGLTSGLLAAVHRFTHLTNTRSLRIVLAALIIVLTSIGAAVAFSAFLTSDHWREHCFGACQLPPDDGTTILTTACAFSGLLWLFQGQRHAA